MRSNALWVVAILVALSSTAFAASTLPKNSVGTKQLKKNAVGTKQLKNGAVTAQKVKKGSLTGTQINASTLGTVPNASHAANSDQLGGRLPSAFQLRVSGSCSAGTAIASVSSDGSVDCAGTSGAPSGPAGGDLTGSYPDPSIAGDAIGTAKLADGAVTAQKLGAGAVDTSRLANGAVDTSKLALEAVNSSRVQDNSLTGADIDESTLGTVPNADTVDGKHASNFLQLGDVAGGDLTGTYPSPSIANDAVTSAKVAPNSLTGADIDESTLGTVPNATHATNADNADTVDGLHAGAFALAGSSAPPSGPAGGDLSGSYPSPSVANGAITDAKVAAANKDGLAGVPSLRTLGSGAQQAMPGNATPGGAPTGAAGGALAGSYPNPTLNVTGGPCPNGKALTNISSGAALSCSAGVYSDGTDNVAAGPTTFPALAGGLWNSALGAGALGSNTSGSYNSAFGRSAMASNTTANSSAGFGAYALQQSNAGANTGFGYRALYLTTSGGGNTAVGNAAMEGNTTGTGNTAIGHVALLNTSGNENTALGHLAGQNLTVGDNNIDIANQGVAAESATTRIGTNGTQTKTFIAGIRGTTTGNPDAVPVVIDSAGQLGSDASLLSGFWKLGGNSGTDPVNDFLGTTDNQPLNFRVDNGRGFRVEPEFGTEYPGGPPYLLEPNVIGGVADNSVTDASAATIAGGGRAAIGDPASANNVTGNLSTIGGGGGNTAGGSRYNEFNTVAGGRYNTATGTSSATVGGGDQNTANGAYSTVPGGNGNTAHGDNSFAAGHRAKANHTGSFVWGDSTDADIASSANNQFIARASGHFFLQSDSSLDDQGGFINTSTGAYLSTGGAWADSSDRNRKMDFTAINPGHVLAKLADLPVMSWQYKAEPGVRHLGPMGQDFRKAFGLGADGRHISTVDAQGVALAAIKALYRENRGLKARFQEQRRRNARQQTQINWLLQQVRRR